MLYDDDVVSNQPSNDHIKIRKKPTDTSVPYTLGSFNLSGRLTLFLLDARTIITIPIQLLIGLFNLLVYFLTLLYPVIFYLIIIWFFWYLLVIYWPFVMQVVLYLFIPILNVFIILFNVFFLIATIILSILIYLWNIICPFIGMILRFIVDLVLTILTDVFNIIGSINWEPIFSAIMNIVMVLVDIMMQILTVLIKVGPDILAALANVISFIIEVILTAIKIILPIVVWIIKLLFAILEPILKLIAIFFGGVASVVSKTSMGRHLLSLTDSMPDMDYADISDPNLKFFENMGYPSPHGTKEEPYEKFIKDALGINQQKDDYIYNLYSRYKRASGKEYIAVNAPASNMWSNNKTFSDFSASESGRRILQSWGKTRSSGGLVFVDEDSYGRDDGGGEGESVKAPRDSGMDDAAHTVAHTLYTGAKKISPSNMHLSNEISKMVLAETQKKDNLAMKSIIQEFSDKYMHLHPKFEDTLASVRYGAPPEHPRDMYTRFHEERQKADALFMSTGRKLMGVDENNWETMRSKYMHQKKIEDAQALYAQETAYKNYHMDRMKVATVVYNAASRSMKKTFTEDITPQILIEHWDSIIEHLGYKNFWHIRDEFVQNYGDAAGFLTSFTNVSQIPIFRYFKSRDPTIIESPYYHDWVDEQRKLIQARHHAEMNGMHGGRKMLAVTEQNEDRDVTGNRDSKESFGFFAILSKGNCKSTPKNILCIPEIPPDFRLWIPLIELTKSQEDALLRNVMLCTPWRLTWCVICWDRYVNAFYEVLFLFSTIPFFNYPIATITVLAPWTGVFLDWIFIVPKFKVGSIFQFVCFVYHLYDLFVTGISLWILSKVGPIIWNVVVTFWNNIRRARLSKTLSTGKQKTLDSINRYLLKMQKAGEISASIGSLIPPKKRMKKYRKQIIETNNILNMHHHYHSSGELYFEREMHRHLEVKEQYRILKKLLKSAQKHGITDYEALGLIYQQIHNSNFDLNSNIEQRQIQHIEDHLNQHDIHNHGRPICSSSLTASSMDL